MCIAIIYILEEKKPIRRKMFKQIMVHPYKDQAERMIDMYVFSFNASC